jgi:hypothetical protein
MIRALIVAALTAFLVAAPSAQAQDSVLASRLDSDTFRQVSAIIDSARAAGLPAEPLLDKAREGALKRAQGSLIVTQVRKRATQLGAARTALFPATDAEILAGADAINWGVPESTLTEIRRARSGAELTVPIGVLADLVGRGVQLDTASAVVIALAKSDMRDNDMIKFRQVVERDIALGSLPAAAAVTRAESAGVNLLDSQSNFGNVRGATTPRPPDQIRP